MLGTVKLGFGLIATSRRPEKFSPASSRGGKRKRKKRDAPVQRTPTRLYCELAHGTNCAASFCGQILFNHVN
jgi:hypothetical protein